MKQLIYSIILFLMLLGLVNAGPNDPVKFGNLTDTTVYIGGTAGLGNFTGYIKAPDMYMSSIYSIDGYSINVSPTLILNDNLEVDGVGNFTTELYADELVLKAPYVNIKYYGAIPDDGLEDTVAIQLALDSGIGAVYVPDGIYITDNLEISSNTTLFGNGFNSVLKLKDGSNDHILENADYTNGDENIIIHNLHFDGNKANQVTGNWHGIRLHIVNNSIIDTVWIHDNRDNGIYASTACSGLVVSNVYSYDNDDCGVKFSSGVVDSLTYATTTYRNKADGIFYYKVNDSQIVKCTSYDNEDDGITLHGVEGGEGCHRCLIDACIVHNNNDDGVPLCTEIRHCTVSNTHSFNNGDDGFDIFFDGHYNTITGCYATNNTENGINVFGHSEDRNGSTNNLISDNYCIDNHLNGISIKQTASNNTITNNYITSPLGAQNYGIKIGSASCENTIVRGNTIHGNVDGSLYDLGTDTISEIYNYSRMLYDISYGINSTQYINATKDICLGDGTCLSGLVKFDLDTNTPAGTPLNNVYRIRHGFDNFLGNSDFEKWLDGTNVAPNGWILGGDATVARNGVATIGSYSSQITYGTANTGELYQAIGASNLVDYTFSAYVQRTSGTGNARLVAQEASGSYTEYESVALPTGAGWQLITLTVKPTVTGLMRFNIKSSDNVASVWLVDECMLEESKGIATTWTPRNINDIDNQDIYGIKTFKETINLGTIATGVWDATDIPLSAGGTGSSLTDPNIDKVLFWDDSAGTIDWLTMSTGLSITDTALSVTGGGGSGGNTTEEMQDAVLPALNTGTQTHITVTYQDGTNDVDFVVSDDWYNSVADFPTDGIGDTKLEYDTGQHLTTTSDVNFSEINIKKTGRAKVVLNSLDHSDVELWLFRTGNSYVDWRFIDDGGTYKLERSDDDGANWVTKHTITGTDTTFADEINTPSLNTGQGDNELYDMDQNVLKSSTPWFEGVNASYNNITTVDCIKFSNGAEWCGV